MTVLHVTETLEGASGVATFVREIDAELKARGVESRVCCCRDALSSVARSANEDPDIIHVHGLWLGLYHRAAQWAYARGIPVVWSTHGMTAPWCMRHKRWKKRLAWWLYQRRDLRRASAIHCTSEQEVAWNAALGLKNCFVVPLGTREVSHAETPSAQRREGVLLFVGRIYPVKGLKNLIKAWKIVKNHEAYVGTLPKNYCSPHYNPVDPVNPVEKNSANCHLPARPWHLRIVGPDEAGHLAELKDEVRRLDLEDSVEFPGPKFGTDLSREYDACDGLVLPSFTENFGATVIDALAHGKPVIASTATPWRELRDRGCGWWVDNSPESLASAIRALISGACPRPNRGLSPISTGDRHSHIGDSPQIPTGDSPHFLGDTPRSEMASRARALVSEKYTWPAVADTLIAHYSSIL